MMPIGLIDANDQLAEVEMDEVTYHLGLSWNEEGQLWTISLRDLSRVLLISGIAVVGNAPLLRQVRSPILPPGELFVATANGNRLVRSSFVDGTATLWYFSAEEIASYAAL